MSNVFFFSSLISFIIFFMSEHEHSSLNLTYSSRMSHHMLCLSLSLYVYVGICLWIVRIKWPKYLMPIEATTFFASKLKKRSNQAITSLCELWADHNGFICDMKKTKKKKNKRCRIFKMIAIVSCLFHSFSLHLLYTSFFMIFSVAWVCNTHVPTCQLARSIRSIDFIFRLCDDSFSLNEWINITNTAVHHLHMAYLTKSILPIYRLFNYRTYWHQRCLCRSFKRKTVPLVLNLVSKKVFSKYL